MIIMLKKTFYKLFEKYSDDPSLINDLWLEVENNYSEPNRFYHTLIHLEGILNQLTPLKNVFGNWDALLFTTFYHDIIYDPANSNNELKSAELLENRLQQCSVPNKIIQLSKSQVLATSSHNQSFDSDTNYFIDGMSLNFTAN